MSRARHGRHVSRIGGFVAAAGLIASALAGSAAVAPPARGSASCLPVHGESILAGDLALANPAFAALDPKLPLGAAPMAGAQRIFRGPELAWLVRQNHLEAGPLRDACFEWPAQALSPGKLAEAMARALGYPADAIEILDQSRAPVPAGELVFEKGDLAPVPGSGGRVVMWNGFVQYAVGRRFRIWAKVRILAPVARITARVALPAGEPIAENLLEMTVVTDGIASGTYATSIAEVAGRVPRTRIEQGTPIRLTDLASPPDIQAGEAVQVEVRNGPMRIRLVARAERSGRIGDTIPMTNPESSAHFRARVDGRNKVVVVVGRP